MRIERPEFQSADIATIVLKNFGHECFSRIDVLSGEVHLGELDLCRQGVLRRACVARKGFEQFEAVGEILLSKVEFSQCHLIGKHISAAADAINEVPVAPAAGPLTPYKNRMSSSSASEFLGSAAAIARSFLFGIVLSMLIDIEFDQLLAKCDFLRIKLG